MKMTTLPSVCAHDCPSACALDVDVSEDGRIGRVRGAMQPYTQGVICEKVARYAERVHHPDRLTSPLLRIGAKGEGKFAEIGWPEALDRIADAFRQTSSRYGAEAVWPYFFAGTMGLVQCGATNRLRNALGYSGQRATICSFIGKVGWNAGIGEARGVDAREMAQSDLIVSWGCNLVGTQVGAMHWVSRARKERGAHFVVIDPYRTATAEKADMHLRPRPGTDAALACAVMHVLLAEGLADRDYLASHTDFDETVERHLASRTPEWAASVTGIAVEEIVAFARLYGRTARSFIRFGYGFTRSRNGAAALHAATCLPSMTGAWRHPGGGALCSSGKSFRLDSTLLEGRPQAVRQLDMSRIGAVLTGDPRDLGDGPPVAAMLVQNSNPAIVAPESLKVRAGLSRDDLFVAVHEQRHTDTTAFADIVLPATTMVEHDDLYTSYGHTFLQVAKAVIPPVGQSRSNHWVVSQLARRLGAEGDAFAIDEWEMIDRTLRASGLPGADEAHALRWIDCARPFEEAHFLDGFPNASGRFRFHAVWPGGARSTLPDHLPITDAADGQHPFRLVTAPSRHFLNSSFNETPGSRRRAERPTVLLHPEDCAELGLVEGARAALGNQRGETEVWVRPFPGMQRGVAVVEGIWAAADFPTGVGMNALTSAEPAWPAGGAVFHDTAVWVKPAAVVPG